MPEQPTTISPPITPRARPRIPSGPRPRPTNRDSQASLRSILDSTAPHVAVSASRLRPQASTPSLDHLGRQRELNDSPLDALLDTEHDFTVSPEVSPGLPPASTSPPLLDTAYSPPQKKKWTSSPVKSPERGRTFGLVPSRRDESPAKSQTLPQSLASTGTFNVSRPGAPASRNGMTSPPPKTKPKPSKLNTLNLLNPNSSPTKPVSPGLKHWQQVRHHVMAPTPLDEKPVPKSGKAFGLVTKAAGKFGFRQAADNMMGYDQRRQSTFAFAPDVGGLTAEEKEEIARERRKFARDVKACLDACAFEETQRRLQRADSASGHPRSASTSTHKLGNGSVHTSQHTAAPRYNFDPNFSSFAPLLMELHRHLPAARAKKLWSRTCPHHAAILSELGVGFLEDGASTDGERQQALEVFGVVVRNWASDSAEEELDRWIWLCRALLIPDRQLRNRGLPLLAAFLHADPDLPLAHDRPHTAAAFQSLAIALLDLLYSLETAGAAYEEHRQAVSMLISELVDGDVIEMDPASVKEIVTIDTEASVPGQGGGLEKELIWKAVAHLLGSRENIARWLMQNEGAVMTAFLPPPILHAAPPVVLRLRSATTAIALSSLANLASSTTTAADLSSIWRTAERFYLPDLDVLPTLTDGSMAKGLAGLFFHLEFADHSAKSTIGVGDEDFDPFRISASAPTDNEEYRYRPVMERMLSDDRWKAGYSEALSRLIMTKPISAVARIIRSYLASKPFSGLGREAVASLYQRIDARLDDRELGTVEAFLAYLQAHHPQLLYKPLFALSASTNPTKLLSHLRLVRTLAKRLGPTRFWLGADPQMIVIVLLGDIAPKSSKGKGKEGEEEKVSVKLGRYACMVELLLALDNIPTARSKDRSVRTFVETLESRLAVMLETEEKQGSLPAWYRALICQLFFKLRMITASARRAPWQRMITSWACHGNSTRPTDDAPATLRSTYSSLLAALNVQGRHDDQGRGTALQASKTAKPARLPEEDLLRASVVTSASTLLTAVQAGLAKEDLLALLPVLWNRCAMPGKDSKAIAFLLMKCGEVIPNDLEDLIMSDLYSHRPVERIAALNKLSALYGTRFGILAQRIIADRRAPIFQFPARTLEYVATEIGSIHWVPPHDVQDAALEKFGTTLPLELRQRLMELGWTEDDSIAGKSDWEQIPVSSLPSLQFSDMGTSDADRSAPSSPMKGLDRHASNASAQSTRTKRCKAIVAPILLSVISEQASILAHDPDALVGSVSRDLLRLLQRDDHAMLMRPFTDGLSVDFVRSLSQLNAVSTVITPAFAYSAMNSITGYLKTVLRSDATFGSSAPALATISVLVPHVSEVSLRDIRKHKAEHVLLPASIHEDEGGFKLHAPWRDGSVQIQTAQLLILTEILRVNPREVYLFKKMVSNLPIQSSISHRPFARAWLVLIELLFSTVNRNYNDRAELRHFLTNVAHIVTFYGVTDLLVVSHALRVFMLCSARFRRLFASMGFSTCLPSICALNEKAQSHTAIRDAVEYASRSFYRIHQNAFVYQACVVISEGTYDSRATYDLLSSLSVGNTPSSGRSSGLRGLNDKEEIEALVQMLSGPELSFSEIGTDAAERTASKMATIDLEGSPFRRTNIVRLLVTVIAANPATKRGIDFLRLFAGILPHFDNGDLMNISKEAVEALGSVILKGRVGEDAAKMLFNPEEDGSRPDWNGAKVQYILLVESFAKSGGHLSSSATKRTLEMVTDLLRKSPETVGPASASILRGLASTHLHASGSRPVAFLKDIAPLFKSFIAVVDFSGLLEEITGFIVRAGHDLDADTTRVVIDSYVGPAVRMLASASEDNLAFIIPLRTATVDLLGAAVFLRGDALGALERFMPNPSLLASLVFPLCLGLDPPGDDDRQIIMDAVWIRLLRYVIRPPGDAKAGRTKAMSGAALAATGVLSLQIVKLICLRAHTGISTTSGLWHYIAGYVDNTCRCGDGAFSTEETAVPRMADWMMWSTFEWLALHRSPMMIEMRHSIQIALASVAHGAARSAPSTPGEHGRPSLSSNLGGRARIPSARSPSIFQRNVPGSPSTGFNPHNQRQASATVGLTPDSGTVGKGGHSRMPSQHLSPLLGHGRMPSGSLGVPGAARPSFADLSARRVSRPAFALPGGSSMPYRFPSSQPVRQVHGEKAGGGGVGGGGGGAIIHLLGAPNQVLGATSVNIPTPGLARAGEDTDKALRELRIKCPALAEQARRGVRSCQVVFGLGEGVEEDVRVWTTHDAIREIAEQTRLLVEEEFRELFVPSQRVEAGLRSPRASFADSTFTEGYSMDQIKRYDVDEKENVGDDKEERDGEVGAMLPKLRLSIN